eukprot:scaffold78705_cov39-Phaeocystis_antarctica.AAC.1
MAKLTVATLTVANPDPDPNPNPDPHPEQVLAAVARALANLTFDLAMSSRAVHDGALPHLLCACVWPCRTWCAPTHAYTHMHVHVHVHMHTRMRMHEQHVHVTCTCACGYVCGAAMLRPLRPTLRYLPPPPAHRTPSAAYPPP